MNAVDFKDMRTNIKYLKKEWEPRVYATEDKDGSKRAIQDRAEATAQYLNERQWGPKTETPEIQSKRKNWKQN